MGQAALKELGRLGETSPSDGCDAVARTAWWCPRLGDSKVRGLEKITRLTGALLVSGWTLLLGHVMTGTNAEQADGVARLGLDAPAGTGDPRVPRQKVPGGQESREVHLIHRTR